MNAPDRFELFLLPDGTKKLEICGEVINMKNSLLYKIEREDHTLGNILKMELHKDPKVVFVGYKLPHPLQHHVEIYLQTEEGYAPSMALDYALDRLIQTVSMLKTRFEMSLGPAKQRADTVRKHDSKFSIYDNDAIARASKGLAKSLHIHGRGFFKDSKIIIDDDRLYNDTENGPNCLSENVDFDQDPSAYVPEDSYANTNFHFDNLFADPSAEDNTYDPADENSNTQGHYEDF